MDFNKFKYDQQKKEREAKKHQVKTHLKEVRLKPNIEEHDYQVKLKQAINFLNKRDTVKISLFFRGRQMLHKDKGFDMMKNIVESMEDCSKVERPSKMAGRRITMMLGAK